MTNTSLPALPVEKLGIVYTKPWVVNLMLDLAGFLPSEDLGILVTIEPAAGDGSFLVPMVERLVDSCRIHGREIASCEKALVAFELDPKGAAEAQAGVISALVNYGVTEYVASTPAAWSSARRPGLPAGSWRADRLA